MIPRRTEDLASLQAEIERQHYEVEDLFQDVSAEVARWRPSEDKWSMAGHVAHLGLVNGPYVEAIRKAVSNAREDGGPRSDGPFRHPWIATRFVRLLEPPPRWRVRTTRRMVPGSDADPAAVLETFDRHQRALSDEIERSKGLDLGRIRFESPFFRLLRLSLGVAFDTVLAHNRRHIWLIRELLDRDDFPRGP